MFYVHTDIDECDENDKLCENGKCFDTQGGYYCNCNDGFIASDDFKSCIGLFKLYN